MSEYKFILKLRELISNRCCDTFLTEKSIDFAKTIKNLCEKFIEEHHETN